MVRAPMWQGSTRCTPRHTRRMGIHVADEPSSPARQRDLQTVRLRRRLGRALDASRHEDDHMHESKAITPFGAIDTPAQGATVSGIVDNFGWTLGAVGGHGSNPPNGGTVNVFIDGVPVGVPGSLDEPPGFERCLSGSAIPGGRQPRWPSSASTRGQLTNGIHTISWGVTDSAGNVAGVGSRYFNVCERIGSLTAPRLKAPRQRPVTPQQTGWHSSAAGASVSTNRSGRIIPSSGVVTIQSEELDSYRIEDTATEAFLRTGPGRAPLPDRGKARCRRHVYLAAGRGVRWLVRVRLRVCAPANSTSGSF